ncbi:MAG: hypothetical protein GZ091_02920 [Paludibacter sp.]|nr:hypothetical protein [Paludibacter sp.]
MDTCIEHETCVSLNLSGKVEDSRNLNRCYVVNKYDTNQAPLSLGNTGVTLYGETARIVEIIAVSAVLIIATVKIAKALH